MDIEGDGRGGDWSASPVLSAAAVLGGLLALCVVAKVFGDGRVPHAPEFNQRIKGLLSEAERMRVASRQDKDPVVATMHAHYGMAYARVVGMLASGDDVNAAARVDFGAVVDQLSRNEQEQMARLAQRCGRKGRSAVATATIPD